MPEAYLSIGTNIDRERNLLSALRQLRAVWPEIAFSPIYESEAVGFQGQEFYNLAAAFQTELELERVIGMLREIEDEHGRCRSGTKFSARTLDLDLLAWGDLVTVNGALQLPRPEVLELDFVLRPLADIAPQAVHPVAGLTYRQLWEQFSGTRSIQRVVDLDGS